MTINLIERVAPPNGDPYHVVRFEAAEGACIAVVHEDRATVCRFTKDGAPREIGGYVPELRRAIDQWASGSVCA